MENASVYFESHDTRLPLDRRLAAVAFVDVVGYTRLMELDEPGTYRDWISLRAKVIEPYVAANGGRVVNGTGDGQLLQFGSGIQAVNFALGLQRHLGTMPEYGIRTALQMRVSVHVCDVIFDSSEVFGEGVNIAARLLDFAEPGGIVVSGALYEQVRELLHFHKVDLGFLSLRNIERRVRALKIAPKELPPPSPVTARGHPPSIAVLPMRIYGANPPDEYLAEGMVHEIVGSLAALRELFVVSSGSTIAVSLSRYERASISHVLGVRYLLSGAITRVAKGYRLRVVLSDSEGSSVLWTDSFRFPSAMVFEIQQEIAERVVYSLLPHIRLTELNLSRKKRTSNLTAYDFLLRAMYSLYRLTDDDFMTSFSLLQKAIEADPSYGPAHAMLAKWYILSVGEGRSPDVRAESQAALRSASMALEQDPLDPLALAVYGHTQSFLFAEYERAMDAFEKAVATSPNSAVAWGLSAPTYCYVGAAEEAIERARHALALSPLEPFAYFYRTTLTLAHYFGGSYEESVLWGRKTMQAAPKFVANLRTLAASLAALGKIEEAKSVAAALLALNPDFRVRAFCKWYPLKVPEQRALLAEHLRAAGLPE